MRQAIAKLVGLILVFGPAWQVNAFGDWIPIESVEVVPHPPTVLDSLTILAAGEVGYAKPIYATHYSSNGTTQYLDIYFDLSGIGLPVVVPWSHSESIGKLSPNSYTLTVRTYTSPYGPRPPADTQSITYTVFPEFGDANGDGRVDIGDLSILLTNFDKTGMIWGQGDFDGNGAVDIDDLGKVLTNFDKSFGAAAGIKVVPEPSTITLLLVSAFCLRTLTRRQKLSSR
jgi:hypothetical protein